MAVTDIHNTMAAASTTIAVPSMPLPPGPNPDVLNVDHAVSGTADDVADDAVDHAESIVDDRAAGRSTDAGLVVAARRGEVDAFEALFERWFERSWNVARTVVGDDETAAEVAQDSVLKAWQRLDDLEKPESFGSWLLSITRNRALDRGRRANRSPIVEDVVVADLRDRQTQAGRSDWMASGSRSVAEAVDGYRQQEMVWAAAAALGAEDSALLDLHLRHGLSAAELAEDTGSTVNAAHQRLFRLRRRLGDAIGSYVLWRGGKPLCSDLDEILPSNDDGVRYFNRAVAALVADHGRDCHRCGADRAAILDPAALFASVPLVAVPGHLQQAAAKGLVACGVPAEATPIEKLNSFEMADVDSSLQLTRVVDGPKPPQIRRADDDGHHLLEDDFAPVVDLSVERPEWNPGPILSEAEISGPFTSPDVISDATETQTWRMWLLSPAAMVGIGVGLALTVMAVVLAARPQPTTGETASGDFGVGLSAGEESALARTATSGGRGQADPQATVVESSDEALDAGSVLDGDSSSRSSSGSSSTASFGAAVDVGDDDDKLVARSAAGAALLTTDEQTGNTTLRDLPDVLAEDATASTDTELATAPVDEAGQPVGQEGLAGGIAAAPPATSPTSSLTTSPTSGAPTDDVASGVGNGRSDDHDYNYDSDDDVDDDHVDDDDDLDDDDDTPSTSVTSRPPTTVSPANDARPTESSNPPTTPTTTRPSTTAPATTQPPTTERVTTTPPRPTDPPTTATPTTESPVDTDDDDEVDDDIDDEIDDDIDDDDVEADPVVDEDNGNNSSGSNNAGGTPSETRPVRDSNPSDTRTDNRGGSGGGN